MSDWYAPNQQAVRGDGSGPAAEGSGGAEPREAEPSSELDELTKAELIDLADERGIYVQTAMSKAEIRAAVEAG